MVAEEPEVIHIEADSDLARHLEAAGHRPVILDVGGTLYHFRRERTGLNVTDHPSEHSGPERTRAAMRDAAGSWSDIDAEELKEYIYRGREERTRPADRPRPIDPQ